MAAAPRRPYRSQVWRPHDTTRLGGPLARAAARPLARDARRAAPLVPDAREDAAGALPAAEPLVAHGAPRLVPGAREPRAGLRRRDGGRPRAGPRGPRPLGEERGSSEDDAAPVVLGPRVLRRVPRAPPGGRRRRSPLGDTGRGPRSRSLRPGRSAAHVRSGGGPPVLAGAPALRRGAERARGRLRREAEPRPLLLGLLQSRGHAVLRAPRAGAAPARIRSRARRTRTR